MAKANWNEYDATAANNTVVDDIDISEGCAPSTINNAIREIMAHTRDVVDGTTALSRLIVDNIDINGTTIGHTSDTDLLTLTSGDLTVAGTVTTTGAIELGHASDTTLARASAGELTVEGNAIYRAGGTDVPVADGGTGASTHTANNVLVGAGTSAITSIAPGADGQVLTSTGSVWQSEAAAAGGKMLQVVSAFDDEYRTYSNTNYASPAEYTQLECTITPAATTSKIFLQVSLSCGVPYGQSGSSIAIIFKRDSTVIGSGDNTSRGSAEAEVHVANAAVSDWDANMHHLSGTFVDSPSSTSAIDYKVFIYAAHGTGTNKTAIANSGGYNYGNAEQQVGASTLTAIEIGA